MQTEAKQFNRSISQRGWRHKGKEGRVYICYTNNNNSFVPNDNACYSRLDQFYMKVSRFPYVYVRRERGDRHGYAKCTAIV